MISLVSHLDQGIICNITPVEYIFLSYEHGSVDPQWLKLRAWAILD